MTRAWQPPKGVDLETDPRFPSGRWTGFWVQQPYPGRQYMSLNLTFAEGRVQGEGTDRIGEFTMTGQYDVRSGNCSMVKGYIGAHTVTYEGRNEDDGLWIWGLWHIQATDRGGFHLWPANEEDPTGRKLRAARRRPAPRKKLRLAPIGETGVS